MNQSTTTKASVSSEIISTQVQGGGNVSVNFTFIMADNTKIAMNTKRKFEAQVCFMSRIVIKPGFNLEFR